MKIKKPYKMQLYRWLQWIVFEMHNWKQIPDDE